MSDKERTVQRAERVDRERLAMLAAKAIQINAFAVADVQETKPRKAHLIYRKAVAAHMAELREVMGAEWVERECGWPEL